MMKTLLTQDISLFLAQSAPSTGGMGPQVTQLLFLGLMFAAMYFLLIAPQRKKQKEHEKMLAALGEGDEVVTSGGIYGVITNVKDDRFVVRIAEGTRIELGKSFVTTVLKKTGNEKK